MNRRQTDLLATARLMRAADPLPPAGELARELARALPRTRAAVATDAGARRRRAPGDQRRTPGRTLGPVAAFIQHRAPWGIVHVAAGDGGVVSIELASDTADFLDDVARRLGGTVVPDAPGVPAPWRLTLATAARELDEYFTGTRHAFDLPVDLQGVSAWDRLVLDGARRLGYGEVTSYGGLAKAIGRPRAARAVGGALGRNPVPVVIPCHRIVAGDGTIGGYGGGGPHSRATMLGVKRSLLAIEGVRVRG